MASYQAIIDVIVNGQSGLDRVIQRTDQLNSLIRDISRNPVDLTLGSAERNIRSLSGQFNQTQRSIQSVEREIRRADSVLGTYGQRAFSARRRLDSLSLGTKAYADATRSLNSAIAGQSAQLARINGLRERLNQLQERSQRQGRAVGSAEGLRAQIQFANSLADSYLRADVAIRRASGGLAQIPRNLSVGGKASEIQFFNTLAASVEYTSEAFRKFSIASQAASFSLGEASRRRFSALAEAFSSSPQARTSPGRAFSNEELSETRGQVQNLINAFPQVARSTAGLEDYRSQLSELLSLLPIASREFIQVASAMRQVDDILSRVSIRDASKPFGPAPDQLPRPIGPATDIFTKGLEERQRYADRRLKVEQNLYRLTERIEDSVGDQSERTRLLVQANQALNALSEDRLEDAARELSIIERQRQAYSRLEKQQVQGKFTPLGGGAEVAARQRFDREQVGGAQRDAATQMSWNLAFAKVEDFAKEIADLADEKKARNKMTWGIAFAKANEIAKEVEEITAREDGQTKMSWSVALEALNDIAADLEAIGKTKGKAIKANWTVSLAKLEQFLSEGGFGGGFKGAGQAFRAGGPGAVTASLASPRRLASQQTSALLLQEKLTSLEIKGVNASAERASLQQVINSLSDSNLKISDQLLNSFDDQLNSIREYIKLQNQVVSNEKARQAAEKKGGPGPELTGFAKSFSDLQKSLGESRAFFDKTSPAEAIDQIVRQFSDARGPSSGGGIGGRGKTVADNLTGTFASSLKSGAGKMVSATTSAFNQVTQAINDAFGIASPSRFIIQLVKNLATTYVSQLQQEYPRIQAATERAFGGLTTERPVSQLVATNRGFEFVGRPSTGYSPLQNRSFDPSGMGGEMDEMFRRFRNQIAQLTTQPEIYRNILNALPSSAITTDLAGAASRRAAAAEIPSFMSIQRQIGPGELEREIENTFANYLKGVRIPNPWIQATRQYEEFVLQIQAQTEKLSAAAREIRSSDIWGGLFSTSRNAIRNLDATMSGTRMLPGRPSQLALPPGQSQVEDRIRIAYERSAARGASVFAEELEATLRRNVAGIFGTPLLGAGGGGAGGGAIPPGGGGGLPPGAGGAAGGGDEARSTLNQLRDLTRLSTRELGLLAQSLEEIQQELRPTAAGFDALNNQLNETRRRIQIEQAARDPDADFFARRRIDPRVGNAISEGLIGGAFPLLFGQGLGASIGGGVGGAAGGFAGGGLGFGLSLIGTALGTAFDTLNTNIKGLASSLKEPTQALEAMKTAGLRVTPELEDTVKRIEALGFASSAQNLVLKELERQLGQRTVVQLQALNAEQKRLESEWSRLSAIIASGVLPGLTGFVSLLADVASGLSKIGSIELPPWLSKSLAGAAANTAVMGFGNNPLGIAASYLPRFLQERGVAAANKPQKPVGSTPEQARQQQLAPFQAQLDALTSTETIAELGRGLIDQVRAAAREQQDLDRQRADLVESYERAIADIRLGVERRVQQQRLENLAKENEILAKQGEIRLQELRNENAAIRESLRGNEIGQELFDIVSQYTEQQLQTENEIANRRRNLQVELETAAIATEQYKIDVAKQIADLNRSTAKQVEQIQLNVARRQQDAAQARFGIEKQIALARIEVERVTAQQRKADLTNALATEQDQGRRAKLEEAIGIYDRLLANTGADSLSSLSQRIANTRPQRAPSFAGVTVGGNVSTAALDAVSEVGTQLKLKLEELNRSLDEVVRTGRWQDLKKLLLDFADQGVKRAKADFDDLIAEVNGDPLGPIKKRVQELNEQFANGTPLMREIVNQTGRLAIVNTELATSYEFFASAFESQRDEIASLKDDINVAIAGSTALEQTVANLTARGISPAADEFQRMVANAKEIDRLRDKRQILEDITTASLGLSDALRGLVQDTLELGSLSDAIKAFNDTVAKQTLNLFLEIAFRPIEQAMQKGIMEALKGVFPNLDLSTEAQQQIKSLQSLNATAESIYSLLLTKLDQLKASGGVQVTPGDRPGVNTYTLPDGTTFTGGKGGFEIFMRQRQGADQPASNANQNQLPASRQITQPSYPRLTPGTNKYGIDYSLPSERTNKRADQYPGIGRTVGGPQSSAPSSGMKGMGGPEAFPLPADYPTPSETNPVPVQLVNPPGIAPGQVVPLETVPYQPDSDAARQVETNLNVIDDATRRSAQSTANTGATVTEAVRKNNAGLAPIIPQWQASLGGVVTGLTLATTGVMGILGGIQQIKQGGTGNVLSGIGGILTTVGSIGLSAAGMFGGGGAGGGGGFGGFFSGGSSSSFNFDPGAMLGGPAFTPFAKGGVVKSPTLFRFGDGGQFGVMGEAEAEAVMPLKRGPDGRLGVEQVSEGGDSGSRLREAMGRSPAQGGQASEVRIKFETTMINGVEYVSKDQLDQAMEQTRKASVSEGSRRGMSMTLDKLKQSPSTRSRVGIR